VAQVSYVPALILSTACLLFAQRTPQESLPSFNSESKLVLVSFNVVRGAYFAPDVKKDDVVLLQDGKPREFAIFEGPGSGSRPPLELVLLFDTTTLPPPDSRIKVKTHWDREATYEFTKQWGDKESRSILEKAGADVRVSVYRYDHDRLQGLCRSARDPQTLTNAIRRLPEPMRAEETVPLTMPKGHMTIFDKAAKQNGHEPDPKQTAAFWPQSWTYEAVIDALKDATAGAGAAMRALIVFSEMDGPTTTKTQDAADQANALGIPVYPVVLDYDEYLRHPFSQGGAYHGGLNPGAREIPRPDSVPRYDPEAPPNSLAAVRVWSTLGMIPMDRFARLALLTGADALFPSRLNASVVDNILNVIRDKGLSQYVVGFAPPASGQERKHRLEIKLKSKSTGKLKGGDRTALY
jgi:hypothetical protein